MDVQNFQKLPRISDHVPTADTSKIYIGAPGPVGAPGIKGNKGNQGNQS